ncbi:unnamed protein product [Rhizophagus irregularis]|nr:unnamed protein product [Rhizophagus irregularis]
MKRKNSKFSFQRPIVSVSNVQFCGDSGYIVLYHQHRVNPETQAELFYGFWFLHILIIGNTVTLLRNLGIYKVAHIGYIGPEIDHYLNEQNS